MQYGNNARMLCYSRTSQYADQHAFFFFCYSAPKSSEQQNVTTPVMCTYAQINYFDFRRKKRRRQFRCDLHYPSSPAIRVARQLGLPDWAGNPAQSGNPAYYLPTRYCCELLMRYFMPSTFILTLSSVCKIMTTVNPHVYRILFMNNAF